MRRDAFTVPPARRGGGALIGLPGRGDPPFLMIRNKFSSIRLPVRESSKTVLLGAQRLYRRNFHRFGIGFRGGFITPIQTGFDKTTVSVFHYAVGTGFAPMTAVWSRGTTPYYSAVTGLRKSVSD